MHGAGGVGQLEQPWQNRLQRYPELSVQLGEVLYEKPKMGRRTGGVETVDDLVGRGKEMWLVCLR